MTLATLATLAELLARDVYGDVASLEEAMRKHEAPERAGDGGLLHQASAPKTGRAP